MLQFFATVFSPYNTFPVVAVLFAIVPRWSVVHSPTKYYLHDVSLRYLGNPDPTTKIKWPRTLLLQLEFTAAAMPGSLHAHHRCHPYSLSPPSVVVSIRLF